jgi:hypothetical protein
MKYPDPYWIIQAPQDFWNHAPAMDKRRAAAKLKWPELNGWDMANIYAYFQSLQLDRIEQLLHVRLDRQSERG